MGRRKALLLAMPVVVVDVHVDTRGKLDGVPLHALPVSKNQQMRV